MHKESWNIKFNAIFHTIGLFANLYLYLEDKTTKTHQITYFWLIIIAICLF